MPLPAPREVRAWTKQREQLHQSIDVLERDAAHGYPYDDDVREIHADAVRILREAIADLDDAIHTVNTR